MGSFNFYINGDQCLNMSNFDMFFYQLQRERRFHLSNVQFFEDQGEHSLANAFHEIRSYMDQHPFLIQDYRLIFGMRKTWTQRETWTETMLYRLLKIYYALMDARLFIRSRGNADKNVTVIMLHDTNLTGDTSLPREYEVLPDVEIFLEYVGVEWTDQITETDLYEKMKQFLENIEENGTEDEVTRRFLSDFFAQNEEILQPKKEVLLWEEEELFEDMEEETVRTPTRKTLIHNMLYPLLSYIQSCVGQYCVFQKEIDKNTLDQNMLALLSLVDYITSDLKPAEEAEKIRTNQTLKEESRKNWEKATNDTSIQNRYGSMLFQYKNRLQEALDSMQKRLTEFTEGIPAPQYEPPEPLVADEGIDAMNKEYYEGGFKEMVRAFLKGSLRRDLSLTEWKKAYHGLSEKLNAMEEELALYAKDLSQKYKFELEKRKLESMRTEADVVYSQEDIFQKMERAKKKKQEILNQLKSPKMNPSLTFQDQLNLENTLEKCNAEVMFFAKCQTMVQLSNFLRLIVVGGGLVAFHHFLMQMYVFGNLSQMSAFFLFTAASFTLYLFAWTAPYDFFQSKIRRSMKQLEKDMEIYIRGYFEKAENFKEYINALNELDALNAYIARLERKKQESDLNARKYLWHKVQIQEHLRKSSYFNDLIQSVNPYTEEEGRRDNGLDIQQDVIHNPLYWPQRR